MSELFDDIARVLAGPLPRRRAIFRAAGLLAGAALAGLRPAISEADTVCCDAQNRCCPPNVACCGEGPRGPICCGRGQVCCNGVCCSVQQCCRGTCLPDRIKCCDTAAQQCGRFPCCPTGTTCCDPHVGLCCPAGQVCIVSGGQHLCGQPCGTNFCVNRECCINGVCQPPVCCTARTCTTVLNLSAMDGDSMPPDLSKWLDTGIDLLAGCTVIIAATGTAQSGPGVSTTPDGSGPLPGCTTSPPISAPDCIHGIGAVIGAIGTASALLLPGGGPFYVGNAKIFTPSVSGRLYLAYNDIIGKYFDNSGSYQVSIVGPCK